MSAGGQPLRKNIKLPAEILAELGAFQEAAKSINRDMKDITKAIVSREKEVAKFDAPAREDPALRELFRQRAALDERLAKIELKAKEADDIGNLRLGVLEQRFSAMQGVIFRAQRILSGRVGAEDLQGASKALENLGKSQITSAMKSGASMSSGVAMTRVGSMLGSAAAIFGPAATGLALGEVVSGALVGLMDKRKAAAESSGRIADSILKEIHGDLQTGSLEADWLTGVERVKQQAYDEGRKKFQETETWISRLYHRFNNSYSAEALGYAERVSKQTEDIRKLGRVLGEDFVHNLQNDQLQKTHANELNKRFRYKMQQEGFLGARGVYFTLGGGGTQDRISREVLYDLKQELATSAMRQYENIEKIHLKEIQYFLPVVTEQRNRATWISSRRWRDYEADLQWNYS